MSFCCINILGRREQKAARSQLCCVLVFTVTQDVCEKFHDSQTLSSLSRTRHTTNGTTKDPEAKRFFKIRKSKCKNKSNSVSMCLRGWLPTFRTTYATNMEFHRGKIITFKYKSTKEKRKFETIPALEDFLLSRLHNPACADTNSNPPA